MFVLVYDNTAGNDQVSIDSFKKCFLPKFKIENYNIEIDSINDSIDEVRKISTRQGNDFTTGSLLDFAYFEKKLQINCSWFK